MLELTNSNFCVTLWKFQKFWFPSPRTPTLQGFATVSSISLTYKDTIIDEKNKKIALKIIEDFDYKLGKKSITKDIESVKGSDILKYIKNIPNITKNENELISCEFYKQYNGYYIFKNDKNQECFKYNITWEENRKGFKINNPYKENDNPINYIVTPMKDINTHNEKIFYLKY